jgi:phage terminase small subunit
MKVLQPPDTLSVEEKYVWFETLSYLKQLDTLKLVTSKELAAYCQACVRNFRAVKPDEDQIKALKKKNAAGMKVIRFCSKYGLTPMSRVRLGLAFWDGEKLVNVKKKGR